MIRMYFVLIRAAAFEGGEGGAGGGAGGVDGAGGGAGDGGEKGEPVHNFVQCPQQPLHDQSTGYSSHSQSQQVSFLRRSPLCM